MRRADIEPSYLGIPIPSLPESIIPIIGPDLTAIPKPDEYVLPVLRQEIMSRLQILIGPSVVENGIRIEEPPSKIEADLALPCQPLARHLRQNPAQIAQDLARAFEQGARPNLVAAVVAQSGFLNFLFDNDAFGNRVLAEIERYQDRYGEQQVGEGETMVIDCSSPNVAKYMSVGHLRSTIIGESLTRIHRARGYRVIRDNHLGDWGTQFGMLARSYELWAQDYEELRENTNPVQGLYKLYVRIHEESDKERKKEAERLGITDSREIEKIETSLDREGRQWFRRLEAGDEQAGRLLQWALEHSLTEFQRVYNLLGTKYEYMLGESFYIGMIPAVLQYLGERRIAQADETGALVVDLSERNLNRLVVQKSDESSLYATRDLATLVARTAWFNPQEILYVVGEDQREYFQQVFATFEMMTGGNSPRTEHIPFGMIQLPEGKMSTRAGRVVFLEDVLSEAIDRARQKTEAMSRNLSEDEKETIARQVGVGAVVFFDLGQGRERSIKFDWDQALSFEGRSAPYIQYAHARMRAILRRAQEAGLELKKDLPFAATDSVEIALIKHLSKFPDSIAVAGATNRPDVLAEYVYKTATLFTDFYGRVRVINEPIFTHRNSRLRLTQAAAQVVKNGLNLLCIEAPERM